MSIRKVLDRTLTVGREELETVYIIHGRPLSETVEILGVLKPKIVDLSEKDNETGVHIPPRPMHDVPPLAYIAQPLGIEVNVLFYDVNGIPVYYVEEPPVDNLTVKVYAFLRQRVGELGAEKPSDVIQIARDSFEDLGVDAAAAFVEHSVKAAVYYVFRDMMGYGPLEIPMEDSYVEEVSWFAYDGPVEVVDKKVADAYPNAEFTPTNIFIESSVPDVQKKFYMTQVVRAVTAKARVGLTTARPLAEARIPDPTGRGYHRLAAHLDITSRSPAVTIRKFPHKKLSITELIRYNTLSPLEAAYLIWQLVNRGFILIVGGMASGKTTLLQALISALPVMYKVVTVEDTPELSTPAQNWHPLYVRRAPKESELEDVTFSRLVIHSLRHRGTIVTLGEVRGAEMADLIQAASSGHGAICLPPGTPVLVRLEDGWTGPLPIREVVGRFERGERLEAYSFNPETGVFEWKPVTASVRVWTREWVEVLLESGRRLRMTPDHRVVVYDPGGGFRVAEAGTLRAGDLVPVAMTAPRGPQRRKVECCGVLVPLTAGLARILARYMVDSAWGKRTVRFPASLEADLKSVPLVLRYRRVKGGWVSVRDRRLHLLMGRVLDHVASSPLTLPRGFAVELARTLNGYSVRLPTERHAYALHYALKSWGWDSVVDGPILSVVGPARGAYTLEKIVDVARVEEEGEAYDIEVADNHTFVTADSIVTGNCTFHAHDPESVLARITSPPINAAPESLKLITSIVHIARTKTYARGRPESVRRILRVFEIEDVRGREVKSVETFKWNPQTDQHYPPMTVEGLRELWVRSRTVRTIAANLYADEAPRALVEIYVIGRYLDYLARQGVTDIKEVTFRMTSLYLRLDRIVEQMWKEKYARQLRPLANTLRV